MSAFPLIYGFRHLVAGHGFVAGVEVSGRALLRFEDGEWWVYGVEPAGLCASGGSELEAYEAFKETFRKVLCDSAELTGDFDSFEADVAAIAAQTAWDVEWQEARGAIRTHATEPTDALASLERQTKDVRCEVKVVNLSALGSAVTPSVNCADQLRTAA
jgi:hypothetical protein